MFEKVELLVECNHRQGLVDVNSAHEHSGRTARVGGCDTAFGPTSTEALPDGAGFQAWLRADRKNRRNEIATNLLVVYFAIQSGATSRSIIYFLGVDITISVLP